MKKARIKGIRIIKEKSNPKKVAEFSLSELQDYDLSALRREMVNFGVSEETFALAHLHAEMGEVGVLNGFAESETTEIYTLGTLEYVEVVKVGDDKNGAYMELPSNIF